MTITERFLNYTQFDTQSCEDSQTVPSTARQLVFARYLTEELLREGLSDVQMDEKGYIYATLPANTQSVNVPTIGFIAHYDTSPDCSGANIRPRIVSNYDGGDIVLSGKGPKGPTDGEVGEGIVMSPKTFPELLSHIGEDLIVTDGHTLLGADDKAGIAEIVQAMVWLMAHPEVKHGTVRIAFNPDEEIGMGAHHFDVERFGCRWAYTMDGGDVGELEDENFNAASAKITINRVRVAFNPDEEIGMGAHHFDVERFGCQWAYTMDGGDVGELEYENFNAAQAKVSLRGISVHPGYAKGKMLNAALLAAEFMGLLPADERPETTEGYEGFYHLTGLQGSCERACLSYIIRDHDRQRFEARKQFVGDCAERMNQHYGKGTVAAEVSDQYYNMKEMVAPYPHIVDLARQAMLLCGVTPKVKPIRGGTDGAQLSFRGLPCPNIFAGGINFHGPYEFLPVQSMEKAMQVVVNICKLTEENYG